ncbi:MAG: hypothetical protein A4E28_01246 [Methanocella sp. PtaU1.Bin125]|nr:MAG: hypothetical protein A4E28_01246 [Methanocella sp. PtaU1.Bin125]
MKITEDALETAKAAAKESEVPLWLVGEKSTITDVMIAPKRQEFDTSAGMLPGMMPAGIRRYGKVITPADKCLEPGFNLVERDGDWRFVDEYGRELPIRVVKAEDESTCG